MDDEHRREIMDRIKAMKQDGMGYRPIAKLLNEGGVPTLSGKGEWSDSSVKRLWREAVKDREQEGN